MLEFTKFFAASTTNKGIFILLVVVSPLLLIYLVVSLYLLFRLCCSNCNKKKTKSKKVQTDEVKADSIVDTCEPFLGQPHCDVIIKGGHKRQTSLLRSPAQSALCDVIRKENLRTLKSSLRKTPSDVVNHTHGGEMNKPVKVDLEGRFVIQHPKSKSCSELAVSSIHDFSLKDTNTLNSPITTVICYRSGVSPVNIPCEHSETGNSESKNSASNVDKPFKEHTGEGSSPSSSPFIEIDLGNV